MVTGARADDEGRDHMTGREVERTARPAHRPSTGPADDSTPMPPHSQGAERRSERRSGRTGSRWGLRTLVVGGLAGAAWLLTGAAAHAADQDLVPDVLTAGQPVLGVVTHDADQPVYGVGTHDADQRDNSVEHDATSPDVRSRTDGVLPVVHRVISVAGETSEAAGSLLETPAELVQAAAAMTTIPQRIVPVADEPDRHHIVRELPAPDRLAGEAADSRPVAPVTRPVTELPHTAAAPAPAASPKGENVPEPQVAPVSVPSEASVVPVPVTPVPVLHKDVARAKVGKTVTERVTVRETPGGDGPAPLRARLGAASGLPAAGSGTATDGGTSAAVLPATVAGGTPASQRLPITTDVEARRHDAEAPTVSPD